MLNIRPGKAFKLFAMSKIMLGGPAFSNQIFNGHRLNWKHGAKKVKKTVHSSVNAVQTFSCRNKLNDFTQFLPQVTQVIENTVRTLSNTPPP